MARNLLQTVQAYCGLRNLPIPTGVQSSVDAQVIQMREILNMLPMDLTTRAAFQQNTREATFVSIADEDQGDIDTLCPFGFQGIKLESIFDRTQRLPLYGGLKSDEWQARKAFNITGPEYQFRLRGNRLLFSPALPAAHTIAFEYFSSYYVYNAGTATYKEYWTEDTDVCLLGDQIPLLWLAWNWPKAKGFDYAEEFAAYERAVAAKQSRDNAPPILNMASEQHGFTPGVFVPAGNWPL